MKKKIIFLEPILKGGGGHHMDNLIESTLFFKRENQIEWVINENFRIFFTLPINNPDRNYYANTCKS